MLPFSRNPVHNLVEAHATYVLNEKQNCSKATYVTTIQNMMQDVSARVSLSTAEYKVDKGRPCTLQLTKTFGSKHSASYFELLLRTYVALDRFCCNPVHVTLSSNFASQTKQIILNHDLFCTLFLQLKKALLGPKRFCQEKLSTTCLTLKNQQIPRSDIIRV